MRNGREVHGYDFVASEKKNLPMSSSLLFLKSDVHFRRS